MPELPLWLGSALVWGACPAMVLSRTRTSTRCSGRVEAGDCWVGRWTFVSFAHFLFVIAEGLLGDDVVKLLVNVNVHYKRATNISERPSFHTTRYLHS